MLHYIGPGQISMSLANSEKCTLQTVVAQQYRVKGMFSPVHSRPLESVPGMQHKSQWENIRTDGITSQ